MEDYIFYAVFTFIVLKNEVEWQNQFTIITSINVKNKIEKRVHSINCYKADYSGSMIKTQRLHDNLPL